MLWGLPYVIWLGILAALFFAAAILTATTPLLQGRKKFKVHKTLALIGSVAALLHIYFGLRPYFY